MAKWVLTVMTGLATGAGGWKFVEIDRLTVAEIVRTLLTITLVGLGIYRIIIGSTRGISSGADRSQDRM
jgi:hypothetical protein